MDNKMFRLQQDLAVVLLKIKEESSEEEMIKIVLDFVNTLMNVRTGEKYEQTYVPQVGSTNQH